MRTGLLCVIATVVLLPAYAESAPKSKVSNAAATVTLPVAHVDKTAQENSIRHINRAKLVSALNSKKSTDALTEVLLSQGDHYRVSNTLRDRDGVVEFHDSWYDHIFIQDGEATFLTGGTMVGAVDISPGEKRAVSIAGGTLTPLRVGIIFSCRPVRLTRCL